jgi:phosphoribosyl 1,2-cyclic phosphodiesterase
LKIEILKSGSKNNCYYISDGKTKLLIECGMAFKKILKGLNYKLSEVYGCLISHEHL